MLPVSSSSICCLNSSVSDFTEAVEGKIMGECDKRKVNRTSFVSYISPHLFILFTSLTKNGEGEGYGLDGSDISAIGVAPSILFPH